MLPMIYCLQRGVATRSWIDSDNNFCMTIRHLIEEMFLTLSAPWEDGCPSGVKSLPLWALIHSTSSGWEITLQKGSLSLFFIPLSKEISPQSTLRIPPTRFPISSFHKLPSESTYGSMADL